MAYGSLSGYDLAAYNQYDEKTKWQKATGNEGRKEMAVMGDNGICFALSLLWSNEILSKGMFTTRSGRMAALKYEKAREVFQKTMGMSDDPLDAFMAEDVGAVGSGTTQVNTVIEFEKIKTYVPNILSASLIQDATHFSVPDVLVHVFTSSTVRKTPMMLNFTGNGYGHSVGIYRSSGGHVYFFEPNAGEYKVATAAAETFVTKWVKESNKAFGQGEGEALKGFKLIQLLGQVR